MYFCHTALLNTSSNRLYWIRDYKPVIVISLSQPCQGSTIPWYDIVETSESMGLKVLSCIPRYCRWIDILQSTGEEAEDNYRLEPVVQIIDFSISQDQETLVLSSFHPNNSRFSPTPKTSRRPVLLYHQCTIYQDAVSLNGFPANVIYVATGQPDWCERTG